MKCPLCESEMQKGALGTDNESWISEESVMSKVNWLAQAPTFGEPKLWAYRCPNCGKVELTSEL